MTLKNILLPTAGLIGALMLPLAAQAQVPYSHPTTLHQRFQDQHARIKEGVQSGELTRREARSDRHRLDRVRFQDQRDRFFHHGRLSASERRHQEHELNYNSRDIYHTKHNDRLR